MTFIQKVKEFFKKEKIEEKQLEQIELDNLSSWLTEKNNEIKKSLAEKTNISQSDLLILLNRLKEEIKALENVNINEKKEHERIKQITELGRKEYAQYLEKLIKKLEQKESQPYISQEINKFSQLSAKSHFKATQLIGKEIENIENTITEIRRLETNYLNKNSWLINKNNLLKLLIEKDNEIKSQEKNKLKIEAEINNIKKIQREYEKNLKDTEKQLQEIKESPEAKEKESIIKKKQEREDSLRALEFEIKTLIDKRIIEKYLHIEKDKQVSKIAETYLNNPIEYLLIDKELKIIPLIEKIKQKIEQNLIPIKDYKKAITKLSINEETFHDYKNNYLSLIKEIKEFEEKVLNIKVDVSHLEKEKQIYKYQLDDTQKNLDALVKKQEKLQSQINKLNISIKEELKQNGIILI